MRVILHSNQYSERGDTVNARNYYYALKEYLGIDSAFAYDANNKFNNHNVIASLVSEGIPMYAYSSLKDLHQFAKSGNFTHSYLMKAGYFDEVWVDNTVNCVHSVFNIYQPHGDVYAYVSKWLFEEQFKKKTIPWNEIEFRKIQEKTNSPYFPNLSMPINWVPHIVNPPISKNPQDFKRKYNIPVSCKVIGRIGGFSEFNDLAAKKAVLNVLSKISSVVFVFINTDKFVDHDRVIHINTYISEEEKGDFYSICDLTLNGRLMGESFGFSVCESLFYGVPVIGPGYTRNPNMDGHHIQLLSQLGYLYEDEESLTLKIIELLDSRVDKSFLNDIVSIFSPKNVIERFRQTFLIH